MNPFSLARRRTAPPDAIEHTRPMLGAVTMPGELWEPPTQPAPLQPPQPPKRRLGDMLLEQEIISEPELRQALDEQRRTGKVLGRVLLDSGLVNDIQIAKAIARQHDLEYIDLASCQINPAVAATLSEANSRRLSAIVLTSNEVAGVTVAMADPGNITSVDEVARLTRSAVRVCVASETAILDAIERTFVGSSDEMAGLAQAVDNELSGHAQQLASVIGASNTALVDDGAPVAKLVQMMIEQAVRMGASDVHIEPEENSLEIRFRVDGVLRLQTQYGSAIASALASRLKVMAGLDIAERRIPQDGRFSMKTQRGQIDLRMSSLPCNFGESIVLRLLRQESGGLELGQLGMSEQTLSALRGSLAKPNGMILVTGPTGSGKTTTLYAMLSALRDGQSKLITIEDPIEYRFPGITQVPINTKRGLDFPTVLRAALRQDPDIVMVGEIRDRLTAEIATSAAMTGHLVLSTLHTNDAVATPMRLVDMGVERYLVGASLDLVIAQRLVRRVCTQCMREHTPTPAQMGWLVARESTLAGERSRLLRQGAGCPACGGTGYRGRHAIYEHLCATPELMHVYASGTHAQYKQAAKQQIGGSDLAGDALRLAAQGITTVAEAMRIDGASALGG